MSPPLLVDFSYLHKFPLSAAAFILLCSPSCTGLLLTLCSCLTSPLQSYPVPVLECPPSVPSDLFYLIRVPSKESTDRAFLSSEFSCFAPSPLIIFRGEIFTPQGWGVSQLFAFMFRPLPPLSFAGRGINVLILINRFSFMYQIFRILPSSSLCPPFPAGQAG